MTDTRRKYLRAIDAVARAQEYPPTVREVAEAAGSSVPSAQAAISLLGRDGYVVAAYATGRSLRLTDKGRAALAEQAAE